MFFNDLCVSSLEVIIAFENDHGQGEGEDEHKEGGDDEAKYAGELDVQCWVIKWSWIDASSI